MKDSVFFFYMDKQANFRQGYAMFVIERTYSKIVFYCPSFDIFWKKIENGFLKDEIQFKRPNFRPATLLEINNEGLLPLVHGVVEQGREHENFIVFD